MGTYTQTYTKTDIRRAFENFQADLLMLALRTQAMEVARVDEYAHDILLMAQNKCLKSVHIQLCDRSGKLVKVHKYSVKENLLSDSQRPGENKWPCLPDGKLHVIIVLSDDLKWETLTESGQFQISCKWALHFYQLTILECKVKVLGFILVMVMDSQRDTFVNL